MNVARRVKGPVAVLIIAGLGLSCAACTSGKISKTAATVTATVTASLTPSVTPTGSTTPTATKTPKPTSSTTLGGDCASVLPLTAVDQAVGTPVLGQTAFVVNQPDATVGQVERLNCRYGLAAPVKGQKAPVARVEVSVSLYASAGLAAKRLNATEQEWRQNGALPHPVKVAGHGATALTGYGNPLLIVASGPRTVAVSIANNVARAADRDRVLGALAAAALRGAGG